MNFWAFAVLIACLSQGARADSCPLILNHLLGQQTAGAFEVKPPSRIKVMTYNVAGLGVSLRHSRHHQNPFSRFETFKTLIDAQKPDLLFLQEVESNDTVQKFADQALGGRYRGYTSPKSDPKSPHTAALIRSDLELDVKVYAMPVSVGPSIHRPNDAITEPYFKRRPLIVELRWPQQAADAAPALVFVAVHLKSQAATTGVENTRLFRERELQTLTSFLNSYQGQFTGPVPLSVVGDFNADLHSNLELRFFASQLDLADALLLANPGIKLRDKATYANIFKDQRTLNQLDGQLVNALLKDSVQEARVLGSDGLAFTRAQQLANDSDHSPVAVIYDLSTLLR